MDATKRRRLLLTGLALAIVAGSFWTYQLKTAISETIPLYDAPAAMEEDLLTVHVGGAVNKPGVYRLPRDSKVLDAVNAAGGLAAGADANRLELAGKARDGMALKVPPRPNGAAKGAVPAGSAFSGGKVSLNTAGANELERLPGVGPVLAKRIVEYRKARGPFRSVDELRGVPGIGGAKFDKLKDKLSL